MSMRMKRLGMVLSVVVAVAVGASAVALAGKAAKKESPAIAAGKKIVAAQVESMVDMEQKPPQGVDDAGAFMLLGGRVSAEWVDSRYAVGSQYLDSPKLQKLAVVPSADGKSAWISYGVSLTGYMDGDGGGYPEYIRVTELIAESGGGWKVIAACASGGTADKEAHASAVAVAEAGRTYKPEPLVEGGADEVPEALAPVVAAMRGGTLAEHVSDHKQFVLIGSAPKEHTKGSKVFKKAWTAWGQSVSVEGAVKAGLAPSGTTGYIAAGLMVKKSKAQKKKGAPPLDYSIPFYIFMVVDQEAGAWRVVQVHLSIA